MKKKFAFATVVAMLGTCFSMFSSVPVFADDSDHSSDFVVVYSDASEGYALLISNGRTYAKHYSTPEAAASCCTVELTAGDPLAKQVIEQAKYGDIVRYTGNSLVSTCLDGINSLSRIPIYDDMYTHPEDPLKWEWHYPEDDTFEIVGSVFDMPACDVSSVTIDGQTFLKLTLMDGTNYVIEEGISYKDMAKIASTGFDEEISLADMEFEGKDHCPIWVLPNEDGDVNSDNEVNSADAAVILEDIALGAVGDTGRMNASENQAADVNGDGVIDAQDAAIVLSYASEVGSGMLEGVTLKAYAAQ
ncbi:MAG: dockerin type I repeat-containing protein [Oscillospiraceae bacterium]|nr:dockerin type I repeat-containing protein [Oscillospiraceae bacterium]